MLIVLAASFGYLVYRLVDLQYINSDKYSARSEKQRRAIVNLQAQRGVITDRKGMILAASNQTRILFAEPRVISDPKEVSNELSGLIGCPSHEICKKIVESKNPGYAKLLTGLTDEQYKAVTDNKIFGIGVHTAWERQYPMGAADSHVVGFVSNYEQAGLSGVELKFDSQLRGSGGKNVLVVDARRRPIGMIASDAANENRHDGCGLILTLDSTIQQFTRSALAEQIESFNAESGVAVVMDPWSGEILSLVSLPDFVPEEFSKMPADVLRNRAVTDPFEPGSIFKPIVAAVALDAGAIGYNDVFFCEYGSYHGKGFGTIGEWGHHRFGDLSVKDILVHSSNIGVAKIGQKLGRQRLYDGVKLFGFGEKTGIDIPGEDSGIVRDVDKWDGYSVTRVPFGHELTVTVIQIARAYCILANGGCMVHPHLVKAVYDADGTITRYPQESILAGRIIKPEVADWIVKEALVGVVKEGTGKKAALDKWQVFGKTGTADIAGVGGYANTYHVASFAGGAPVESPEVIVVVSIRNPEKSRGYTGGTVAAPVVKNIIEKTLTYLERSSVAQN